MTDMTLFYAREVEQDLVDRLALQCDRREWLQRRIGTAGPRLRPPLERLDAELTRRIAATERRIRDVGDVRDLFAEAAALSGGQE